MEFVPFGPQLEGVPNVIVDGAGNAATTLVLSHWPGNATPVELKADTSTEIVLNYLRRGETEFVGGATAVSNNHFDIDGLMGIWALLHPEEALDRSDLVVAVAECGDFERWEGEHAAKVVCAINGLESMEPSPLAQTLVGVGDHHARTGFLYEGMLDLVSQLLTDIESFEEFWTDEYQRIEAGRKECLSGTLGKKENAEVDLAVFELPDLIHTIAINEQTHCSRVALIIDGERYVVRYRYESWVEYVSRDVAPRVDLAPFAELLQTFEGNPGYWEFSEVSDILPVLRFRDDDDDMAPSSITSGLFVRLLTQFLGDNSDNESLLWSPATAAAAS